MVLLYFGSRMGQMLGTDNYIVDNVAQRAESAKIYGGDLARLGWSACLLSLAAYAIYFSLSGIRTDLLAANFSGDAGANYELKATMERVPGVTSFMSIAPFWFLYLAYKRFVLEVKWSMIEIALAVCLLLATTLRAVSENERRAIIDLFIPAALFVMLMKTNGSAWYRLGLKILPTVGISLLIFLFLATEYFRTWSNFYSQNTNLSYPIWALLRLGGYYSTSVNNGIAGWDFDYNAAGYYLLHGLYRFPVIADYFGLTEIRQEATLAFTDLLTQKLNPEFNNQGGLVVAFWDLGLLGGSLLLTALGLLFGFTYAAALQGRMFHALLYPTFFLSALEITRVWYLTSAVSFSSLIFLIIAWPLVRIKIRKS